MVFWKRIAVARFRPVAVGLPDAGLGADRARAALDGRACSSSATLIAWVLGNLLGGLAGYYRDTARCSIAGIVAMGFHPIPYYIVAFVLLIVFGYLWPVLPISGGSQMNLPQGFDARLHRSACCSIRSCRSLSLVLVGLGGWFMGMRSLVSNIVTEDYVIYAELGGVARGRILRSYVMRNALVPQVTGLAMSLGAHLQRRHHHRAGLRLSRHRHAAGVAPCIPATTAWCSASPRCRSSPCRSRCC